MSGVLEAVRRVNLPGRVEHSVRLRVAVLAGVLLAIASTGMTEAAPSNDAILAFALLPIGALVSWNRAGRPNLGIKAALAVGAVLALVRFFDDLQSITTVELARRPLASLFLAVQVLHGFDLPARRDLGFTLASSLTLIALAAANTYATWFLFVLAVYGVLGVLAMLEMQRSAARQRAEELIAADDLAALVTVGDAQTREQGLGAGHLPADEARVSGRELRDMAKVAVTVVLLGGLAFSLIPRSTSTRLGGLQFQSLPFTLPIPPGLITNDGLGSDGLEPPVEGELPLDYNPSAYFGFAQNVDLRTVGTPLDIPVLRVRADRPRLWRGMVFDTYTGIGWTRPGPESAPPELTGRPASPPLSLGDSRTQRVVQTVELLADTPNLIFAASQAKDIYAGGLVTAWGDGTLSTTSTQLEGSVYSVVSLVNITPREELRRVPMGWGDADLSRWTQLPSTVPQRVHDLARDLTAGVATPYAKAEAIEDWLGENTEYSLDAPPPPLRGDVVDHFLFTARQGWCEPIASSMVVLLRSVGIPARFSTGFQPGMRNPITGVFDVRMANAHAWVEVNIPGYGWIEFDPTGAVPQAVSPEAQRSIPLIDILHWVRDNVVPAPIVSAVVGLGRFARDQPLPAILVAMALGASALGVRRVRAEQAFAALEPFEQLELLLANDGLERAPGQTPRQFVAEVARRRGHVPVPALDIVLGHEEARRYGADPVPDGAARAAVERVRDARPS